MSDSRKKSPIGPYVKFPRSLAEDFKEKRLTRDEFFLHYWLQLNANPYGIFTNCTYQLLADTYAWKVNKVNKIMLALLEKKYIQFPSHRGSRTPFDVKIINFLTSKGTVTKFDDLKETSLSRTLSRTIDIPEAEPLAELEQSEQNFEQQKSVGNIEPKIYLEKFKSRTPNNDNDNKNNNKVDVSTSYKNFPYREKGDWDMSPDMYMPKHSDEDICREIALDLKEESMKFILSRLYNPEYGIFVIEKAWGRLKETKTSINNPRAYFNKLLDEIREEVREPKA